MDSNIMTLIEQSNKYNNSKTNFFKTKLFVSNNHSPNREYSKHVAQTETVQYNRYQSKEVSSGRNSKKISFNTYLLNLAKQNIDQFPKVKCDFANIQMVDLQVLMKYYIGQQVQVVSKRIILNEKSLNYQSKFKFHKSVT
ncbi:unnamed protein product [Paramecium sonneborni]|uniref:Uncharacterized protein n=1 Tax=Paramecium sonneborni TaxID=65129 RepID=A0A8S1PJT7_9CILI|nr:unnamed protein product [Paramecium sonneborni]